MTVTSGEMNVLLPAETKWKTFGKGETFIVEKDKNFKVKFDSQVAYICVYK
jgi:uncharacterized protein YaiE (UPF0345 family)